MNLKCLKGQPKREDQIKQYFYQEILLRIKMTQQKKKK